MYALYAASIAVLIRNLVRIIEYAQGSQGFIASHEAGTGIVPKNVSEH